MLLTASCTLHTVNYSTYTEFAKYTLHTAYCILHSAHRKLHSAHCTQQTTQCTLHTANYTVHTAHSKLNIAQRTQQTTHSTVHTANYTTALQFPGDNPGSRHAGRRGHQQGAAAEAARVARMDPLWPPLPGLLAGLNFQAFWPLPGLLTGRNRKCSN